MVNALQRVLRIVTRAVALVCCVWSAGGILFLFPEVPLLCAFGAMIYVVTSGRWFLRHTNLRDWSRWSLASLLIVWGLGLTKQPSNDRNWAVEHAVQSEIAVDENDITIQNFRRCRYTTDTEFSVQRDDLTFPLSNVNRMWFIVHRFTSFQGIAHNFLSFEIDDGRQTRYVCVSVEVRREHGEAFSPWRGMYRGYELIYVFADELDEIGQRLQVRPADDVYLFPVNASAEQIQTLFLDIADRANRLRREPEFYHSLLNNCTNNIVLHTRPLTTELTWLDPRVIAPGFADRYAKAMRLIGSREESFADLQQRCRLRPVSQNETTAEFSQAIRVRQE